MLTKKRHRSGRRAQEAKAPGEEQARRLLKEGLHAAGLTRQMVEQLKGTDSRKVAIATVIRENTTVSMTWISDRLGLKSPANASQQIRRWKKACHPHRMPKELKRWVKQSRNAA